MKPFGKGLAVFFSAFIFGLMHGNIPQMASAFTTALIYGLVAVSCDSIVPTIVIHILNNVVASYPDFADVMNWSYSTEILLAVEIFIIFIGVFLAMGFSWKLAIKDKKYAMTFGQRCSTVFTNIPMALYFLYSFAMLALDIAKVN